MILQRFFCVYLLAITTLCLPLRASQAQQSSITTAFSASLHLAAIVAIAHNHNKPHTLSTPLSSYTPHKPSSGKVPYQVNKQPLRHANPRSSYARQQ